MTTVKLSTFDRLVNIHQSVQLEQTKKINKRILQEQLIQNAELQQLNNQLASSNQISRKILENQIREIEHKEVLKFYKTLSFKMFEFIEPIDNISEPLVKKYFIDRYYERIKANILTATNNLEEINDKIFNKSVVSKINEIKKASDNYTQQFNESPFYEIDALIEEVNIKKQQILDLKPPQYFEIKIKDKPKNNPLTVLLLIILGGISLLFLFGIIGTLISSDNTAKDARLPMIIIGLVFIIPFLLFFRKFTVWRKSYPKYLLSQHQKRQVEKLKSTELYNKYLVKKESLNEELLQHSAFKTYENIVHNYPEFDKIIIELSEMENQLDLSKSRTQVL